MTYFKPFNLGLAAGLLVMPVMFTFMSMSNMQRRGRVFFGVTVDPEFSASTEAARIIRLFRWKLWALAFAATLAIVWFPSGAEHGRPVLGTLLYLGGFIWIYRQCWKLTRPYASSAPRIRSVSLDAPSLAEPSPAKLTLNGTLLAIAFLIPMAMAAWTALYLHQHAASIPSRFPVKWNEAGAPVAWRSNTPFHLYFHLAEAAGLAVVFALMMLAAHYRSRRSDWGGTGHSFKLGIAAWMALALWMVSAIACVQSLLPVHGNRPIPGFDMAASHLMLLLIGAVDVFMIAALGLTMWARKRYAIASDGMPDECWKWGMFYVNANDPALVVPKRFGYGFSFNFGHAASWIFLGAILSVATIPFLLQR